MTKDDLKPFCLKGEAYGALEALLVPWTKDGFTYATNGHILIRVPAMDDVPADQTGRVPKAENLIPCSECDGRGKLIRWYSHDAIGRDVDNMLRLYFKEKNKNAPRRTP